VPDTDSVTPRPGRRVVYSALIGGYENPRTRPTPQEAGVDYLLFTDSDGVRAPLGWTVVKTAPRFASDPVRSARYLKIVGHPILDDYDETLWIDNRVVLRTSATRLFEFIAEHDIALPRHSLRADLKSEFAEVIAAGYDDPRRVREMFDIAVSHGVEHDQPLWTGLVLRRRTCDVAECMQRWFELLLLTSRRDQLSINVALAASPLRVNTLDFEIVSSDYHDWVPNTVMNRDRSIQMWRSRRRPLKLGISDAMRSFPYGRKGARVLTRMGLTIPTLGSD
jgi:hypothetical protein